MSGVPGGNSKKSSSRTVATKALIIQEFKRRLRDNIRSLNDNFYHIINAGRVNLNDDAHKNFTGKMTELYTTKNEMAVRAQLMVRAGDELLKLTTDIKEFLILHDFHFLTHSIRYAEVQCEQNITQQSKMHQILDTELVNLTYDIDKELSENFYHRH